MSLLASIRGPADVKALAPEQLRQVVHLGLGVVDDEDLANGHARGVVGRCGLRG